MNLERVLAAVGQDSNTGFCTSCGHEQDGCEPDARQVCCENCQLPCVSGAEEILMTVL